MTRLFLLCLGILPLGLFTYGQTGAFKMLYVLDSTTVLNNPRTLAALPETAIAQRTVVTDRDSLKLLGKEGVDGITFIFTKEYQNRPDSVKKIPSLSQLKFVAGYWYLGNNPYTGKFIDYFLDGKVCNEGALLNGKVNGELLQYYSNGTVKFSGYYSEAVPDGLVMEYYRNGALRRSSEYRLGRLVERGKIYYINGKVEREVRKGKNTDTVIGYSSAGVETYRHLVKNGLIRYSKQDEKRNTLTSEFNSALRKGDLKEANRTFYKLWKLDGSTAQTDYLEGTLALRESRFDEAIGALDKALEKEPMMAEAYSLRAYARVKKYNPAGRGKEHPYLNNKPSQRPGRASFRADELAGLPEAEKEKVFRDLRQADFLNYSE